MKLAEVKNGKTFKIGDIEFIKINEENGRVSAVAKKTIGHCICYTNDCSKDILPFIEEVFTNKLLDAVGKDNVYEHEVDLLALDGTIYGMVTARVSIPTLDFYRQNRMIFDKHKLAEWWWLATPESIDSNRLVCVAPSGYFNFSRCSINGGVRPFCIFNSSIFVS